VLHVWQWIQSLREKYLSMCRWLTLIFINNTFVWHWSCYFELIGYCYYFHSQIVFVSFLSCFLITACDKGTFERKVNDTGSVHWAFSSWLLCFLITACDKGTFGEGCRSICHCLNGVGCNHVNGQCPHGDCYAGWKPSTCSEGKVCLLLY
jgi:hypothetical protein